MDAETLRRLDGFLGDPNIPQDDKNRAIAMARLQESESAPGPAGARARSGNYLWNEANRFVSGLQGIGGDIENLLTGKPYGAGFPGERGPLDTASDVLTTAAPVVAPGLTAAGLAAGTLARGAGYSEPTAQMINAGTQLGLGLANTVGRGILGVARAKPEAKIPFQQIKQAAIEGGKRYTLDTPEGAAIVRSLERGINNPFTKPKEAKLLESLLEKMQPGTWSGGYRVAGPGLDYGDLDRAYMIAKRGSAAHGIINDAMQGLLDEPMAAARLAAQSRYASVMSKPLMQRARFAGGIAGGVAGGYYAGGKLLEGKWKEAIPALVAGTAIGSLSTGQLMRGARAMAGPLAQTAVGVGAQMPNLAANLEGGGSTPETSPEPDTTPLAPEPTPAPGQIARVLPGPYGREIAAVSSLVGVPQELIRAHMRVESGGGNKIGDNGRSFGVMQIQPGTAATVAGQASELLGGQRPDLMNPLHNLLVGGLLLRRYLDKTNGDWAKAAQMYNGGEHTTGNPQTRWYAGKVGENFLGGG